MWLPNAVINAVNEQVDEVFYLSYVTTRVFNDQRSPGTPMVFSGWYWAKGLREAGPFKSQSSAYRDAWYRLCSRTRAPIIHETAMSEVHRQERAAKRDANTLKLVAA